MPALRPIVFDNYGDGPLERRQSIEDGVLVRLRERPAAPTPPGRRQSNRLGNALAGYRLAGGGRARGGSFAPRATSGTR